MATKKTAEVAPKVEAGEDSTIEEQAQFEHNRADIAEAAAAEATEKMEAAIARAEKAEARAQAAEANAKAPDVAAAPTLLPKLKKGKYQAVGEFSQRNPYSKVEFPVGLPVEVLEPDSWLQCQVAAKLIEAVR